LFVRNLTARVAGTLIERAVLVSATFLADVETRPTGLRINTSERAEIPAWKRPNITGMTAIVQDLEHVCLVKN